MKDKRKTKEQLIGELAVLSQRVTELETLAAGCKLVEKALRASEAKFRSLAEQSPSMIFINKKGRIIYANEKCEQFTGYSKEELCSPDFSFLSLVAPASSYLVKVSLSRCIKGEGVSPLECTLLTKDGNRINAMLTTVLIEYEGETAILSTVTDIAERKRAEEALKDSERRYRAVFETTGTATAIVEEDMTISLINQEFERRSGYSKKEVEGKKRWTEFVVKDDLEGMKEYHRLRRIDPKAVPRQYEFRFINKQGEVRDVFVSVNMIPGTKNSVASLLDISERKRAEEAVKESQGKYQALFSEARDGIVIIDAETGNIIDVNIEFERQTGRNIEQLRTMKIWEVRPPEKVDAARRKFVEVRDRGTGVSAELDFQRPGGEIIPIEFASSKIRIGDKQYIQSISRDITERKQVEEALRSSEEKLRAVIENSPDIIQIVDSEGIIREVSSSVQRILGYKPEELIGRPSIDFVHPDDLQEVAKGFQEALNNPGVPIVTECRCKHKDGTWRVIEGTGSNYLDNPLVNGFIANMRDITERKRAEEALRESEEKYRTIFESTGTATAIMEEDYTIALANAEGEKLFGYSKEEVEGKMKWTDLVATADDLEKMKEYNRMRRINPDAVPRRYECKIKNKKGEVKNIIASVGVIPATRQSVASALDITERKQAEEREKKLQQELYLASRLASIGRLAAGVAHEINNPLTGIVGFSERLLRENVEEKVRRGLERIHNEALRAAKVIQNLLTFGRRLEPKKEYSDINDIVQKTLELRAYELKTSNIEVVLDLAPGLPRIVVDFQQVEEVFLNLILNAEQAMTETGRGGKLGIKTQKVRDYIRISFTDDGPGIPKEHLDKLFDPFFTTRGERGGTGLGLSVCHGIVVEHGGRIYIRSQPGKWATFFVELPVTVEEIGRDKVVKGLSEGAKE